MFVEILIDWNQYRFISVFLRKIEKRKLALDKFPMCHIKHIFLNSIKPSSIFFIIYITYQNITYYMLMLSYTLKNLLKKNCKKGGNKI